MTYVMQMSTDNDIINTATDPAWNPIAGRYTWAQINPPAGLHAPGLNIPNQSTIVVIAHGADSVIGNQQPNTGVDIEAELFLFLIDQNMAVNGVPGRIYISACAPTGLATFTAQVILTAQQNNIWQHVQCYGHTTNIAGAVPPPNSPQWQRIF